MCPDLTRYRRAVDWVLSLQNFEVERSTGEDYHLDRVLAALHAAGDPQDSVPSVHVAGTKGKGSVCAMTASILRASGQSVGLFTSPHLHTIRERIQVNGRPIARGAFADLAALAERNATKAGTTLTTFEALTLMAFLHFRAQRCMMNVIEVGLGGRLDATNVMSEPMCSAVATIGLDRTEILGTSINAIAREKAGIAKRARPFVVGPQSSPEAAPALVDEATRRGATVIDTNALYSVDRLGQTLNGQA